LIDNFAFQMKVIFMLAAGVNVFIFYSGTRERMLTFFRPPFVVPPK
jgi:hypothetical protein